MVNKRVTFWAGLAALVLAAVAVGLWLANSPEDRRAAPAPRIARALIELRDGKLCPKVGGPPFSGVMYEQTTKGQLLTEVPVREGVVHGVAHGWHENGQMEVEEIFVNGVSHGVRRRWHPNGRQRNEATIVNGLLHGPYTEWHDNGQVALRMNMVEGTGEGESEAWLPDGRLKSRITLRKGQPVKTEYFTQTSK